MNRDELFFAIGYLVSDLKRNLTDTDIRHDWRRLAGIVGTSEVLTDDELELLRRCAE